MSVRSRGPASHSLSDYSAIFRRRRWVVVVCGLVGLAGAAAVTLWLPVRYTSTVLVHVTPVSATDTSSLANSRTPGRVNLDTEALLVPSTVVATRAAGLLKAPNPRALADSVTITVPPNSGVLAIAVAAPSAGQAQRGAASFAQAYLDNRASSASALVGAQMRTIQSQLNDAAAQLQNLSARAGVLRPNTAERSLAFAEQDAVSRHMETLNSRLSTLQNASMTPGRVVSAATLPHSPSEPVWMLNLVSGLVCGLLAGILAVLGLAHRDRRIRSADDLAAVVHLPVLIAPDLRARKRSDGRDSLSATVAFQDLSTGLVHRLRERGEVVLVAAVSGRSAGEVAAAGVAEAIARTSVRVSLVKTDATAGAPGAPEGARTGSFLADVRGGGLSTGPAAPLSAASPPYQVFAARSADHGAPEMLDLPYLRPLVDRLGSDDQVVVLATRPVDVSADACVLADVATSVVLAVEVGRSRSSAVRDAVKEFRALGANVVGFVLTPKGGSVGARTAGIRRRSRDDVPATGERPPQPGPLATSHRGSPVSPAVVADELAAGSVNRRVDLGPGVPGAGVAPGAGQPASRD
ncbi:MAG: Wzz/FepE/Etk N-terminal domain-containing protein [Frankiaceae bacterium]